MCPNTLFLMIVLLKRYPQRPYKLTSTTLSADPSAALFCQAKGYADAEDAEFQLGADLEERGGVLESAWCPGFRETLSRAHGRY